MKKEVSPVALVGIVIVVVVALAAVGYKMLQPAPYQLSPGATNAAGSGSVPGKPSGAKQPESSGSTYYPSAPPGSIPGKPADSGSK